MNDELKMQNDELRKMVDALSGDRDKKATILANKIRSKLQIEYDDFMSAVDMPMSIELGENLRDQMKNIFKALEKLGIKFE